MDESTITITIKGHTIFFNGNELVSPIEEAIEYLEGLKDE
jgi:hypothetical protein